MRNPIAFFILWALFPAPGLWAASQDKKIFIELMKEGDRQVKDMKPEGCRRAASFFELAAARDPQSYEAHWKAAKAYTCLVDHKTHLLIEEKDEYKPTLKHFGGKAHHFGKKAYSIDRQGKEALVWYLAGYAYHTASMGILTAVFKGAGFRLKSIARELIAIDDDYFGAFGYWILGRFHLEAPFPFGSKDEAVRCFELAVSKEETMQNYFWLGEAYLKKRRWKDARDSFHRALNYEPRPFEAHVAEIYRQIAKKRLQPLSAKADA